MQSTPARERVLYTHPTAKAWAEAQRLEDRAEARRFKLAAMFRTINEYVVAGRLSNGARVVLAAIVDAVHPDKVRRRIGPDGREHAVLRAEISRGRIAKVAAWSPIDEGQAPTATEDERKRLSNAIRRVTRALAELQAAGILSRQRVNGGRSVTIVELVGAPVVVEPGAPGGTSSGGTSTPPEAVPTGGTSAGGTSAPGGTISSRPVGQNCPVRWDKNVPPIPTAFPKDIPQQHCLVGDSPLSPKGPRGQGKPAEPPAPAPCLMPVSVEATEPPATDEYHNERVAILQAAGVTGRPLADLSVRRLLPQSIKAAVGKAKRRRNVESPTGLLVSLLRELPDDWAEGHCPPIRRGPSPAVTATLGPKFKALWRSLDQAAWVAGMDRPDAHGPSGRDMRAAIIDTFLDKFPQYRNATDRPHVDRPEFQAWFVAGIEADITTNDQCSWVFIAGYLADVQDRLFRDNDDDAWHRIKPVVRWAEAAGVLPASVQEETWGQCWDRAERSDEFIRWCVYNVEALERALEQAEPPAALVSPARIDPSNDDSIINAPRVLNLLVDGLRRRLEDDRDEVFVEAFARVSLLERARQHGGQSPSPSSPEYLRFVVEEYNDITNEIEIAQRDAEWGRGLHAAIGQFPSIIDDINRDGVGRRGRFRGNVEGRVSRFCGVARYRITADEIVAAYQFRAELAASGAKGSFDEPAGLDDDDNQRLNQRLLDIINAEVVEPAIRAEREAEDKRVAAEINAK